MLALMDTFLPFVFGLLILIRSAYVLISGSASADSKGLLRDEEPMIYWLTVIAGFAIAIGLFIFAWRNWHGV
jgi:nitrate reductase gamma subunit